jgi:hypothetical protein
VSKEKNYVCRIPCERYNEDPRMKLNQDNLFPVALHSKGIAKTWSLNTREMKLTEKLRYQAEGRATGMVSTDSPSLTQLFTIRPTTESKANTVQ